MILLILEHVFVVVFIASLVGVYLSRGRDELFRVLLVGIKNLPGINRVVNSVLQTQTSNFIKQSVIGGGHGKQLKVTIPDTGNCKVSLAV